MNALSFWSDVISSNRFPLCGAPWRRGWARERLDVIHQLQRVHTYIYGVYTNRVYIHRVYIHRVNMYTVYIYRVYIYRVNIYKVNIYRVYIYRERGTLASRMGERDSMSSTSSRFFSGRGLRSGVGVRYVGIHIC